MNNTFRIAYGDYDLEIDRGRLTYRLTETKTGTVWADGLPVGWIEFEDRFTEGVSRYDFGQTTLFSLSEKAGAGGKEILFGLECLGVPIDLLFTCAEREIRLTVEANRDSKTHRVSEVCLLPGLCHVPDDGVSHLVVPHGEGAVVLARDAPARPQFLRVWDDEGLSMPFFGAVRAGGGGDDARRSALALIADSAYGAVRLEREEDACASLSLHFARDPERRRLELRVVPLPESGHITIARAYRDKVIADRQHVTLRRKVRDKPEVDGLLGAALVLLPIRMAGRHLQAFADAAEVARDLKNELGVERALCVFYGWETEGGARGPFPAIVGAGGDIGLRQASDDIRALGFLAGASLSGDAGPGALEEIKRRYELGALAVPEIAASALEDDPDGNGARWDDMDRRMDRIALAREQFAVFGSGSGCDWSSVVCDWWEHVLVDPEERDGHEWWSAPVPLYAAVYHDSVVAFPLPLVLPQASGRFLRCLLSLSPPHYYLARHRYFDPSSGEREYIRRTYAVLGPLHRLSFPAFLTEHRFLTPDFAVEEARYSNGARVVINGGGTPYEDDDLLLPPQGFFVEHPQMVAHDAGRVGAETFPARAWRIVRARDDKPLAGSADVERREFPV